MMALMLSIGAMNAQVMPAKLFDNVAVELKGGISTPLNDPFAGVSPAVGLEVEKYINPWLGVAIDGTTLIANPYGEANPHTMFDLVNVNGLVKFNVVNMFTKFDGTRNFFEPVVFTGIGWGHRTCSEFADRNYMTYKAGAELNFNLGKQREWAIRLTPAVVWGPVDDGRLNINNGGLEIMAGVAYRFKNHDDNHNFTLAKLYNQNEIDELNDKINKLREKNCELCTTNVHLKNALENQKVQERVIERIDTVMLMPRVQFNQGGAKVGETTQATVEAMAEYMKSNDKTYTLVGYASTEGSTEFNQTLSVQRAEALKKLLVELGVDESRLTVVGNGETDKFSTENLSVNRVVIVE